MSWSTIVIQYSSALFLKFRYVLKKLQRKAKNDQKLAWKSYKELLGVELWGNKFRDFGSFRIFQFFEMNVSLNWTLVQNQFDAFFTLQENENKDLSIQERNKERGRPHTNSLIAVGKARKSVGKIINVMTFSFVFLFAWPFLQVCNCKLDLFTPFLPSERTSLRPCIHGPKNPLERPSVLMKRNYEVTRSTRICILLNSQHGKKFGIKVLFDFIHSFRFQISLIFCSLFLFRSLSLHIMRCISLMAPLRDPCIAYNDSIKRKYWLFWYRLFTT